MTKIDDLAGFQKAYDASGTELMNLQKAVIPYDWFVRCIGLGPQTAEGELRSLGGAARPLHAWTPASCRPRTRRCSRT